MGENYKYMGERRMILPLHIRYEWTINFEMSYDAATRVKYGHNIKQKFSFDNTWKIKNKLFEEPSSRVGAAGINLLVPGKYKMQF